MAVDMITKLTAEFLGTFLLVLTILASGGNFLVIGAALAFIVFFISSISGAAVNPAVSAALWYSGSLSTAMYTYYALAELAGGFAAAYAYKILA
jgi:glycerol uptake facilitator-like aquaporin